MFQLPKGGNIPVCAHGSRWITHKRNALLRVIDRYGAYIAHLITLSEDSTVKADDRAKIKGYLKKWMDYKVLYGAALYANLSHCLVCLFRGMIWILFWESKTFSKLL